MAEDQQDVGVLLDALPTNRVVATFNVTQPVNVCPACYAERDTAVPLFRISYGPGRYTLRLPSGERLRDVSAISVRACLACNWSESKEE